MQYQMKRRVFWIVHVSCFEEKPGWSFIQVENTVQLRNILDWVDIVEDQPRHLSLLSNLPDITRQVDTLADPTLGDQIWERGYRSERALRKILDLESHKKVSSIELVEYLGLSHFKPAQKVVGIDALITRNQDNTRVHLSRRGRSSAARKTENFAFARAVGDAICFNDTRVSVINNLDCAERQATSRAFSAEFLAPIDEVLRRHREGKDDDEIADVFDVSTKVIEHQLENRVPNTALSM